MVERFFHGAAAVITSLLLLCPPAPLAAQTTSIAAGGDSLDLLTIPRHQFGFGASNAGFHIHYSANTTVHVGLYLHLDLSSYDSAATTVSGVSYEIGPYIKYLLLERGDVMPYVHAALTVIRPGNPEISLIRGSGRKNSEGELPETEIRLRVAFGAEHFFSHHLGIYTHVYLAHAYLSDPAAFNIGLVGSTVGAEFFF